MLTDILFAMDAGDHSMLTLLDLSAAFDTVDNSTPPTRLKASYGVEGAVFSWLASYLEGRSQYVRSGRFTSTPSVVTSGVPQGSILGLIPFQLYTADLQRLIEGHSLRPHLLADDTQIYGFCASSNTLPFQQQMVTCIDDLAQWMHRRRRFSLSRGD